MNLRRLFRRQEKPLTFPLSYRCPNCHSTKRLVGIVEQEERAKGKVKTDMPFGDRVHVAIVLDPTHPPLSAPQLIFVFDVCARCGTEYICKVLRQDGPVNIEMKGGRPLPPFPGAMGGRG